jgi:hypothetical protein
LCALDYNKKWEDWKEYGNAIMSSVISAARLAGTLYDTEGFFEGWQHNQFHCWDTAAQWKVLKDERKCPVQIFQSERPLMNKQPDIPENTWSGAYRAQNSIYLSKIKMADPSLTLWKSILDSDRYIAAKSSKDVVGHHLPGKWLSDENINSYATYCVADLPMARLKCIRVVSTFLWQGIENPHPKQHAWKSIFSNRVS